jgi:hypothetical protein
MDAEEKKLQIKLAKLQADVQMWLALSLAFLATCGGLLIGGYQIRITSVTSDLEGFKNSAYIVSIVLIIAFGFLAGFSILRMKKYRDDMDKL